MGNVPTKKFEVKHPKLKKWFEERIDHHKSLRKPFSYRLLTDSCGIASPSTVHDWIHGISKPEALHWHAIAKFFADSTNQAATYEAELARLCRAEVLPLRPRDRDHRIRFGVFEAPPFANYVKSNPDGQRATGYLDRLLGKVKKLAAIELDDSLVGTELTSDLVEDLRHGDMDLAVGVYDVLDRADLLTWSSNCRMGLNAVLLEGDPVLDSQGTNKGETIESVQYRLNRAARQQEPLPYLAIVGEFASEVGRSYVDNVITAERTFHCTPTPDALAAALVEQSGRGEGPIVLSDEWTCLDILTELHGRGQRGVLLFPLSTETAAQNTKTHLPAYSIGLISTDERNREYMNYARHLLTLFLRNETEFVVSQLKDLHENLRISLEEKLQLLSPRGLAVLKHAQRETCHDDQQWIQAIAMRSTRYMLRLNDTEMSYGQEYFNLPWQPILRRALRDLGPIPEQLSDGKITLGVRPFEPFAKLPEWDGRKGSQDGLRKTSLHQLGFMGQILKPLESLIHLQRDQINELGTFSIENKHLGSSTTDVRLGFVATPLRAYSNLMLRLPVQIPLSACLTYGPQSKQSNMLRSALDFATAPAMLQEFEAVVLRRGSAEEFLTNFYEFKSTQFQPVHQLTAQAFLEKLSRPTTSKSIFSLVDCLTSLEIFKLIEGDKTLLSGINSSSTAILPAYYLCVTVASDATDWVDYFQRNWRLLIEGHEHWFVEILIQLHSTIVQLVNARMQPLAGLPERQCLVREHFGDAEGTRSDAEFARLYADRIMLLTTDLGDEIWDAPDLKAWLRIQKLFRAKLKR